MTAKNLYIEQKITAMFYRSNEDCTRYWVFNQEFLFRFPPEESANDTAFVECIDQPGTGPELHTHEAEETFYVLEGEVTFSYWSEEDQKIVSFTGGPGTIAHIDSNVPHGYKNSGDIPSRLVGALSPGSQIVNFFKNFTVEIKEGDSIPAPPSGDALDRFIKEGEAAGIFPWTAPE